jgi:uncharacterized protein with FMN-binding domain
MKNYIIAGVVIVVLACGIFGFTYLNRVKNYKDKVDKIVIEDVNLKQIKDGNYYGEFDADLVAAKVEVEIKDNVIKNIKLIEHKTDKGAPAEVITQKVVEAQSLKVDVISGATNSSKVILKAIQNALA